MAKTKYDLDINKQSIIKPVVILRQGDYGIDTMQVSLAVANEPMDLTGATIKFMGTTANGSKIIDNEHVKIIDAHGGVFEYVFPSEAASDIGEYKVAYFSIVQANGQSSTMDFRVQVLSGVDITASEANGYVSQYGTLVTKLNSAYDSATKATNQKMASTVSSLATSAATVLDSALARVNNVNSTANSASSAASKAVSMASSVANTVTSQASYINSVTSSAASNVSSVAAGVVNKLNNISVGGRNYILNSKFSTAVNTPTLKQSVDPSFYSDKQVTASVYVKYDNVKTMVPGKAPFTRVVFTVSFMDASGTMRYLDAAKYITSIGESFSGRVSQTIDLSGFNVVSMPTVAVFIQNFTADYVEASNPKLEIGNIATDWTPAPEDAPSNDAQLVHKTGPETIAGDKTFTGKVAVSGELDADLTGQVLRLTNPTFSDGWTKANIATLATNATKNNGVYALNGQVVEGIGTDVWGYMRITPIGNASAGYVEITVSSAITAIPGMDLTNRKLYAYVASSKFDWQYAIDGRGGQRIVGTTTLDSVKSSGIKTGSVTANGLRIYFREFAAGIEVWFTGNFTGDVSSSWHDLGQVPSNITKPFSYVTAVMGGRSMIGSVSTLTDMLLMVHIDHTGKIQYQLRHGIENNTADYTNVVFYVEGSASYFK